jgi:LmbE family N-acetylglucosaminyl deacetylase
VSITVDLPAPRRVLAVGAHPDDIEFGCGATLAKWADAGTHVSLCVCTDGAKGSWDPNVELAALVARREAEQRDAAAVLGAADVELLGFVDGELHDDDRARAALCAVIRRSRPDVVLGHDPWRAYRLHPDHRAAGRLTIAAIVAARDPHFFPDQALAPHRPATLLLFEPAQVHHVEDVRDHLTRKVAALLAHRSQWRSTMGIEEDSEADVGRFAARIEGEARAAGLHAGLRAAETFSHIGAR